MGVTLLICLLVPILLLVIWKKKTGTKAAPVLFGAATFIVFVNILEAILHQVVLKSSIGATITGSIVLYAVYGGLAAGIFEETGRLLAMKGLMKKTLTPESSIMFGIGHGGAEAIILGFFASISNIITAIAINMGTLDTLMTTVPDELRTTTYNQLSALWTTPSWMFFVGGYERLLAIFIHLCCSYIVFRAIADNKIWRYFLAIAIHAFIDGVIVVINARVGAIAAEAILTVLVVVLVVFTVQEYRDRDKIKKEALKAALEEAAKAAEEAEQIAEEAAPVDEEAAPVAEEVKTEKEE